MALLMNTRVLALRPNDERERWEPAAADARIGTDLNGWLPSAPRYGGAPDMGVN